MLVHIKIISYLGKAFSLGVLLFGNMVSRHSLLTILSGFILPMYTSGIITATVALIPFFLFVALSGLEVAVSIIQTYVFCILTSSYIKDTLDLHLK